MVNGWDKERHEKDSSLLEKEHNLIGRKGRLGEGQNVNDPSQMAKTGQNWEE